MVYTANALNQKFETNIPRKETVSDLYTVFPSARKRNTANRHGAMVEIYKSLTDTLM